MAKVKPLQDATGVLTTYLFWCPACKHVHPYRVARAGSEGPEFPIWTFNGDVDKPTFTASLLVFPTPIEENGFQYQKRCHLFLTEGRINYCSDSDHALAGQVIDCPEWDDERW